MNEYVFRYAEGFGFEPTEQPTEHERNDDLDHYGTIHEEIVRCRYCKYASAGEAVISGNWQMGSCHNPRFRMSLHAANVRADGFCAWAERRQP